MAAAINALAFALCMAGCASVQASPATTVVHVDASEVSQKPSVDDMYSDISSPSSSGQSSKPSAASASSKSASSSSASSAKNRARKLYEKLDIAEDYRDSFVHGDKPVKYQKYIVLHDTEGDGEPEGVIAYWDGNGAGVAAHFVVGKNGHIVQCVPLDKIAHHAGFGDTGHNELYGVEDESRDDKVGTSPIGDWASDYGMNSYSVGIEMMHVSGEGDYPEAQLEALDKLIAYIDASFGKESTIIDHKAWRTGNSDTSAEFADYLENYQDHRTHV